MEAEKIRYENLIDVMVYDVLLELSVECLFRYA